MSDQKPGVIPSKLENIPTEKIRKNPHNPRVLFDDQPLALLRESIQEVGILVPILVYESSKTGDYIILDGERRWMCANKLGLNTVPANILEEPSPLNNILRMFNIHNVREPWDLMPTALKLEVVMRELGVDKEAMLAKITSLPRTTVRRCKILLSFDKHYQDMMLEIDPTARIKPDLFIEMHPVLGLIKRKFPKIDEKYPRKILIDIFVKKYLNGKLNSVLDFRKIVASIRNIGKGLSKESVEYSLLRFLTKSAADLNDFIAEVDDLREAKSVERSVQLLITRLSSLDEFPNNIRGEIKPLLIELKKIIEEKLARL